MEIKNNNQSKNANADLEELILAYVFFYIKPEYFYPVLEIVNENHFFFRENKLVFLALKEALKQDMPLHPKTIRYLLKPSDFAHLADENLQKSRGLDQYFAKLMSNVELGVFHLDIYQLCMKLKDLFLRRRIDQYSHKTLKDIGNNALSTDEVLDSIEKNAVEVRKDSNFDSNLKCFQDVASEQYKEIQRLFKSEDKIPSGVSTGFSDIDKFIGGFAPSDLIILAGRPSMGKTGLALNIAVRASKVIYEMEIKRLLSESEKDGEEKISRKKQSILIFSLEMSSEQLANRVISMESGVNSFKMRTGRIKHEEMERVLQSERIVSNLGIDIDDTGALNINTMKSTARRLSLVKDVKLIIVDYLQLLSTGVSKKYGSREQEVSTITQGLKAIAKELKIPVLALSQLSRAVETREDKRPQLSDLRDSGSIEQEADLVMFIYREAYYKMNKQPKEGTQQHEQWQSEMSGIVNKAEIIIAKHRNGPVGTVSLHFDPDIVTFHTIDTHHS
ncbi:replicative DNA helicase [Romboutsia sp.]|uniref:replicative DNA helicase n=1 Tax=Romboutsia sp. TaxID=1965302 RepID=UPI003F3993F7